MHSVGGRSDSDAGDKNGEQEPGHGRQNSVGHLDANEVERQKEADKHVASYVSDQLERLKTRDVPKVHDEFEAQLDGT